VEGGTQTYQCELLSGQSRCAASVWCSADGPTRKKQSSALAMSIAHCQDAGGTSYQTLSLIPLYKTLHLTRMIIDYLIAAMVA
jgi:hypothetical protein